MNRYDFKTGQRIEAQTGARDGYLNPVWKPATIEYLWADGAVSVKWSDGTTGLVNITKIRAA